MKKILFWLLVCAVCANSFTAECEVKNKRYKNEINRFSIKTGNGKLLVFTKHGNFSYPFESKYNESYMYSTGYGIIELGKIVNGKFNWYETDGYFGTCYIK